MPAQAVLVLAAALAVAVCTAPLGWSLAVLVGSTLVVPATLPLPNGFSSYLTVDVIVWLAAAAGIAVRISRGDVDRSVLRITPLHVAVLGMVLTFLVVGVALSSPTANTGHQLQEWVRLAEQLLFFAVAVAYVRAIGDSRAVLSIVAGTLLVYGAIGVAERIGGFSWGHWLFSNLHSANGTDAAGYLEQRGGQARVRAGAEFALQYAWVCAMLLPAVLARLVRSTRRSRVAWAAGAALVLLAITFSVSRSAYLGVAVGFVVLWAGLRLDRRMGVVLLLTAAAGLAAVTLKPSLLSPYRSSSASGSSNIRVDRLPVFLAEAAGRPVIGEGLASAGGTGFGPTDASYLQYYVEVGAVGLTSLAVALAAAGLAAGRGLPGPPGRDVDMAAVGLAGVCVGVVGAAAFDGFALMGSAQPFWLLAAMGLVAGERAVGPVGWPRWAAWRTAAPLLAVAAGLGVSQLWPARGVEVTRFTAFPISYEAAAAAPVAYEERMVLNTACDMARAAAARSGVAAVAHCTLLSAGDSGVAELRVDASDPAAAQRASASAVWAMEHLATVETFPVTGPGWFRPSGARVVPEVAGLAALAVAGLWPARRRNRAVHLPLSDYGALAVSPAGGG